MQIINHFSTENDSQNIISHFLSLIGLAKLTHRVNFKRHSLCSLKMIVAWLMTAHFERLSINRAHPDCHFTPRTARNVLNDGRINWQKLVCLVAIQLIRTLTPFIDGRRRLALVLDDTLLARRWSQKTELLAKTYDHDKHEYVNGYRGLTLGWSDGNTFLPINFALMSTHQPANLIGCLAQITDQRQIAGQRRAQAQRPMNQVALELIRQAQTLGVSAKYVLFDSWYSSPKMFWQLAQLQLFGVGMLKRSAKVYYRYRGRHYSIKGLYQRLAASKMNCRHHYLYSSVIQAQYHGHQFPLKVVFVSKKGHRQDYLVLATTNLAMRPEEIIQLYGRRWQIETYFKAAKQYLALNRSQIQSYDGQCGYIAVTMITYDLLAWQERLNTDDRTIGGLFYIMNQALPDIRFMDALVYLFHELGRAELSLTDHIDDIINRFIAQLPITIQKALNTGI